MGKINLKSEIKVVVLGEKSLFCRRRKKAVNMYTNKGFGVFHAGAHSQKIARLLYFPAKRSNLECNAPLSANPSGMKTKGTSAN